MRSTKRSRNGDVSTLTEEIKEYYLEEEAQAKQPAASDDTVKPENRLAGKTPPARLVNRAEVPEETPKALAIFCYEDPTTALGRYVARATAALARRQIAVHLFSRQPFEVAGVSAHPVGECTAEDLLGQVREFARRASNACLQQFARGAANLTLLGFEWSSVPVLSILREVQHVDPILSLHSLERQRSDMTQAISRQIEERELTGLREARTILVQDAATAEIAKYWVPDCAARLVTARQPFPVEQFEKQLDAGAIKARFQVGPVDPMILYIGDLSERYGPDVLVKGLPGILRNNKQVRLVLVGDGQLYWPLRVYARYLLLEHAVRFAGDVQGEALLELIQAADVIAVPSRESTPWWPILAGWAASRPVIATHPAAPALLEHEQDSVLFYPNENSCVWGVERVLFDPKLATTMTRKGKEKLETRFGWNSVAAQIEELMGVPQPH